MAGMLDKLDLKPQERRLLVFVLIVVFVVLNFWFIFPRFGELGQAQRRIQQARQTLELFKREVDLRQEYLNQESKLVRLGGLIPIEEQITAFSREVQSQATLAGVKLPTVVPGSPGTYFGTNAFFEEQTLVISIGGNTREAELVSFLYNLGKKSSLIRVSSMNIKPDQTKMYLFGSMTLVKSFQRKGTARAARADAAPDPAPPPSSTENKPLSAPSSTPSSAPATSAPAPASADPAPKPTRELPKREPPNPITPP